MRLNKVIDLLGFKRTLLLLLIECVKGYAKQWDKLYPDEERVSIERRRYFTEEEEEKYQATITKFALKNINPAYEKPNCTTPEGIICENGRVSNRDLREGVGRGKVLEASEFIGRKYKLKTELAVYRGVEIDTMEKIMEDAKELKGIDFYDKGFLFASLIKTTSFMTRDFALRIFIPKGTCAFYSGNVNGEYYNQEIVVQKGAKLKIRSVGMRYINCELISTE